MHMKILGFIELIFAIIVGGHLLYSIFPREIVFLIVVYILIRGVLFAISSKDMASIIDILFGVYVLLALYGFFSNSVITIAFTVWLAQKGLFSLLLGH